MSLSPEQAAAVLSDAPRKKVLAGAGTGKTFLLVHQIAYWLQQGVPAGAISAVTFTRRAGKELSRRVHDLTGEELGYLGTIHSFCLETLWQAGRMVIPLDPVDLELVIAHVADDCNLSSAELGHVYKRIAGEGKRKDLSGAERLVEVAVRTYMAKNGLVWVGDLLRVWLKAFAKDERLVEISKARMRFMLWDEFQDSSDDEVAIYEALDPFRLMVIGDPRQAIYIFRGAVPAHMINFKGDEFHLTVNRRSTVAVVEEGNDVAPPGYPRMVADRTDAGTVDRLEAGGHSSKVALVTTLLDAGARPVHVLCRQNREVAQWGRTLEAAGIDVHVVSSKMDPYSTPAWRDAYVLARWVVTQDNPWLQSEVDRMVALGRVDLEWVQYDVGPGDSLNRLLLALSALADEPNRVRSMKVLDFARWYGNRDLQDQLPDQEEGGDPAVVVMTVHASKGLEFENVVLADVGGRLGGKNTDEEKNLLYVGVTRARDRLVMEVRSHHKGHDA